MYKNYKNCKDITNYKMITINYTCKIAQINFTL